MAFKMTVREVADGGGLLSCCFAFGWVAGDPRAARGAVEARTVAGC
jgi:hypothetical protein